MSERFDIGERIWVVATGSAEVQETCRDCLGTRFLTVIMGDGEKVSIECEGCSPGGYQPARGYNIYRRHFADPVQITVEGLEIGKDYIKYKAVTGRGGTHHYKSEDVFKTLEEAKERSILVAKEYTEGNIKQMQHKYKKHRTWSWNATYYRKQIRKAEEDIKHYSEKLDYAKQCVRDKKAKEVEK